MPNQRKLLIILFTSLIVLVASIFPYLVQAQTSVIDSSVQYDFGEQIIIFIQIRTDLPVDQAVIVLEIENETQTIIEPVLVTPVAGASDEYSLKYTHDLSAKPLRAFARIDYSFEVTLKDGSVDLVAGDSFVYKDDRFDWQEREEEPFRVYWYEGDVLFAQQVLDTAQEGLEHIQNLLPYPIPTPLEIYIYPSFSEMQDALNPNSPSWVAGHADPDLGVIVLTLPKGPDQYLLMEQRIPHELMHIALYQETGSGYTNIPTWLNEGLASLAELYPNPDYRILLGHATDLDSLLPMSTLCSGFPREASNALLAYAQADSFTRYLYNSYGSPGLQDLVQAYTTGLDCEHGAKTALGKTLTQLERQWRSESLGEDLTRAAINNLIPWFVLILVVLGVPISMGIQKMRQASAAGKPTNQVQE